MKTNLIVHFALSFATIFASASSLHAEDQHHQVDQNVQRQQQCQQKQDGYQGDLMAASEHRDFDLRMRSYEKCLNAHWPQAISCYENTTCPERCGEYLDGAYLAELGGCINHEMGRNTVTSEKLIEQLRPVVQRRIEFLNGKMLATLMWTTGRLQ